MVMSGDQYAGRCHSTQTENSSFERVEIFKYLGKTPKESKLHSGRVKSRIKSGNVCYQSVLNLLCYSLPTKNIKVKIYRTIILTVVCMDLKYVRSH